MSQTSKVIERDEASIAAMKPGDRVWHNSSQSFTVSVVTRITEKMVYVGGRAYWRASKETSRGGGRTVYGHTAGLSAPGTFGGYGRILRIATPEECDEWDHQQSIAANELRARNEATIAHCQLLKELAAAVRPEKATLGFMEAIRVRDSEHGVHGTYDIVVSGLTEDQVRKIKILKESV